MTRLAVAVIATLAITTQVVAPALAQSADSYLPPEVVPLDPQVASQLAQAQAKAREMNPVGNRGMNVSGDAIGDPTNAAINDAGAMNSRTMRQDVMQSLTAPGNGSKFDEWSTNAAPAGNMANAGAQGAPATLGTSDWIMPAKQGSQSGIATNYGNVEQTQTLTGQTQQQQVRHNTSRGGPSNAMSAMAGFAGGAILGSVLRRPGSLMGFGMYPFMMGGSSFLRY